MPAAINLADPRVKRTRQLLLNAFLDVMRTKSFRDITIQDIADQATVNRGTFYDHFADKFDILEQCMRDQFRQHLADRLPDGSAWSHANLTALILAVADFIALVHHDCRPADREFEPICQRVLIDEIRDILARWWEQPGVAAQAPQNGRADAITAWSWSIYGVALHRQENDANEPAQAMAERLAHLLLRSVELR